MSKMPKSFETYAKPPILEGVLALHFKSPIKEKWIEKFSAKRRAEFGRRDDLLEFSFSDFPVAAGIGDAKADIKKQGVKLTSKSGERVAILNTNMLASIRMAPYDNWESLVEYTRENYETLEKLTGHLPALRFSTRFVNRIDIPSKQPHSLLDISEYFNLGPTVPAKLDNHVLGPFQVYTEFTDPEKNFKSILQIGAVPSPLIDHLSFLLDIDVIDLRELPVHKDNLWDCLPSLRDYKNSLFDACTTEATKELFR